MRQTAEVQASLIARMPSAPIHPKSICNLQIALATIRNCSRNQTWAGSAVSRGCHGSCGIKSSRRTLEPCRVRHASHDTFGDSLKTGIVAGKTCYNGIATHRLSACAFTHRIAMCSSWCDAAGNLTNLYTGPDYSAAKDAVDSAGVAGTILESYVYRNPPPVVTLRYGPGLAAVSAGSPS